MLKGETSKRFVKVFRNGQANLAVICQESRNKPLNFLRVTIWGKRGDGW